MYLPSRRKSIYIFFFIVLVVFILSSFKVFFQNLFITLTSKTLPLYNSLSARQIEELKRKNLELSLKLQDYQDLEVENTRLRKALEFRSEKDIDILGVNIVAFVPSAWRRLVLVNAGEKQKIENGDYAVNEEGYLIGKVIEVKTDYSTIVLADDPNFSMPVFVGEENMGMLKGNLVGAKLMYIENEDGVKAGDRVWVKVPSSSSVVEAGEVKRIREDEGGLFLDIDVRLFLSKNFEDKIFIIR